MTYVSPEVMVKGIYTTALLVKVLPKGGRSALNPVAVGRKIRAGYHFVGKVCLAVFGKDVEQNSAA